MLIRIKTPTTVIHLFKKGLYKDKSNTQYILTNFCILSMLYFDRTDFSEGIHVNTSA